MAWVSKEVRRDYMRKYWTRTKEVRGDTAKGVRLALMYLEKYGE